MAIVDPTQSSHVLVDYIEIADDSVDAIPEPLTILSLFAGLVGYAVRKKRK